MRYAWILLKQPTALRKLLRDIINVPSGVESKTKSDNDVKTCAVPTPSSPFERDRTAKVAKVRIGAKTGVI